MQAAERALAKQHEETLQLFAHLRCDGQSGRSRPQNKLGGSINQQEAHKPKISLDELSVDVSCVPATLSHCLLELPSEDRADSKAGKGKKRPKSPKAERKPLASKSPAPPQAICGPLTGVPEDGAELLLPLDEEDQSDSSAEGMKRIASNSPSFHLLPVWKDNRHSSVLPQKARDGHAVRPNFTNKNKSVFFRNDE
jgi:hypothetical protein